MATTASIRRASAPAKGIGPAQEPARTATAAEPRGSAVLSRAETAECTCPEFCERDHTNE